MYVMGLHISQLPIRRIVCTLNSSDARGQEPKADNSTKYLIYFEDFQESTERDRSRVHIPFLLWTTTTSGSDRVGARGGTGTPNF
jgi:hypothetical protein